MLTEGLKISWRNFKIGFLPNLAILFILIVNNSILLTVFILIPTSQIQIQLIMFPIVGYLIVIILSLYSTRFRLKEFELRKMMGAQFYQIYILLFFDTIIYITVSTVFSFIIVEYAYQFNSVLLALNGLIILKYVATLLLVSFMITGFSAIYYNNVIQRNDFLR